MCWFVTLGYVYGKGRDRGKKRNRSIFSYPITPDSINSTILTYSSFTKEFS